MSNAKHAEEITNPVIEELDRKTLTCAKPSWAKRAVAELRRIESQRDELLAALELCAAALHGNTDAENFYNQARAAIAKAKGE